MKNFSINVFLVNKTKYYEGKEIGAWVRLPNADLEREINNVLGEDKELAIHDAVCNFLDINESDDVYELNKIAFEVKNLSVSEKTVLSDLLGLKYGVKDALNIIQNKKNVLC